MNDLTKNILLWVIIAVVLLTVFSNFSPRSGESREMPYSTFLQQVKAKNIASAVIKGEIIEGTKSDGTQFRVYNPESQNTALIGLLDREGVDFRGAPPDKPNFLLQLFLSSFPVLLLVAIFIYFMRQMQGAAGGRGAMSFGKSRARLLGEDQVSVTFADVAGVEEAKEEVVEIVEFLKNPGKFQKLGGKIPKGVLMVGRRAPARRCWPARLPAKPRCRSSRISGLRFRRDVRRRRRFARARHVRAGQEARSLHHFHRRDRCRRPAARCGPGRRP